MNKKEIDPQLLNTKSLPLVQKSAVANLCNVNFRGIPLCLPWFCIFPQVFTMVPC